MVKFIFPLSMLLFISSPFVTSAQREKRDIGCWMGFDGNLNWYADSLNFISSPKNLPNFLGDYLFDWKLKDAIWECQSDRTDGFSARRAILDRVINEKALRWITESKNTDYDKLYRPDEEEKHHMPSFDNGYPILPFMEYSIRQLAEQRLKAIEKIKQKLRR